MFISIIIFIYLLDITYQQNITYEIKVENIFLENYKLNDIQLVYPYSSKYYIEIPINNEIQSFILDTTQTLFMSSCATTCERCSNHLYTLLSNISDIDYLQCNYECTKYNGKCINNICSFDYSTSLFSSISGRYIKSKIFINKKPFNIIYECISIEDDKQYNSIHNGILGLGNINDSNSFLNQIIDYKIIKDNLFSICLSKKGGYITFGQHEINNKYYEFNYSSNYEFNISYIKVFYNLITNKQIKAIINPYSFYTYLPEKIYKEILYIIRKKCKLGSNGCTLLEYSLNKNQCFIFGRSKYNKIYNVFPSISFVINSHLKIIMRPSDYMNYIKNIKDYFLCLRFAPHNHNTIILGNDFMENKQIIFEKNKSKIFLKIDLCSSKNKNININALLSNIYYISYYHLKFYYLYNKSLYICLSLVLILFIIIVINNCYKNKTYTKNKFIVINF